MVCPNCGNPTTRSNLIDGCDFCRTKFTVEDLEDRVSGFGFRRDFRMSESKREAVTRLAFPWVFLLAEMPLLYFGFLGAFLYMTDVNVFGRLLTGLLAAALFGALGWCLVKMYMIFIVPIVLGVSASWGAINKHVIYREKAGQDNEQNMLKEVRKVDPLFSIQSFFGGVQNKLYAIHFAENKAQINAFSEDDLSAYLPSYGAVIDIDTTSLTMDSYAVKEGQQLATVSAHLLLRELKRSKVVTRNEVVRLLLKKNESCKTQAVCAPSVLRCKSCGSSLSLMDGKTCPYCKTELDMKQHDWVIAGYAGE